MKKGMILLTLGLLLAVSACDSAVLNQLGSLLEDPLGTEPFPFILGGDDAQMYYATNLGDITVQLPGLSYESVLPGLLGPSNVYEFSKKKPELIRPLVPAGPTALAVLATDGRHLAYISSMDAPPVFSSDLVVVEDLWQLGLSDSRVIYDREGREDLTLERSLALNAGRLALAIRDETNNVSRIHVEDLTDTDPTREIEVGGIVRSLALHGNLLAYTENDDGQHRVVLRNLATDGEIVLANDARFLASDAFLTANSAVWAESTSSSGVARVMVWDIPTGTRSIWSESVLGDLVGATDDFLVTQENIGHGGPLLNPDKKPDMIVVRRYDRDGKMHKLAEFRWTGLSGQAQVVGDRAAWVNPKRKIVLAPLNGGDRTSFKPF